MANKDEKQKSRRKSIIIALLLVALFLLTLLFLPRKQQNSVSNTSETDSIPASVVPSIDTLIEDLLVEDTSETGDTVENVPVPEVKPKKSGKVVESKPQESRDTSATAEVDTSTAADTVVQEDSSAIPPPDPCILDTLTPRVFPDPSGGLHRRAIGVKLISNKECSAHYKFEGDGEWKLYAGDPIQMKVNAKLLFYAIDSCGNESEIRSEVYEFDLSGRADLCPDNMEYIKVGKSEFCIDKYEWPNRKGTAPQAFVSLYQAMDSCFSVGKRLCSSEEWTTACEGPHNWQFSYGKQYENDACVTQDTAVQRAGLKAECRGYFEVFDMSGSLAEWTSTPSSQNRSFYNVMGGFWASGSESGCRDTRYSYFPQNRHNPVGFRCCKDLQSSQSSNKTKGSKR